MKFDYEHIVAVDGIVAAVAAAAADVGAATRHRRATTATIAGGNRAAATRQARRAATDAARDARLAAGAPRVRRPRARAQHLRYKRPASERADPFEDRQPIGQVVTEVAWTVDHERPLGIDLPYKAIAKFLHRTGHTIEGTDPHVEHRRRTCRRGAKAFLRRAANPTYVIKRALLKQIVSAIALHNGPGKALLRFCALLSVPLCNLFPLKGQLVSVAQEHLAQLAAAGNVVGQRPLIDAVKLQYKDSRTAITANRTMAVDAEFRRILALYHVPANIIDPSQTSEHLPNAAAIIFAMYADDAMMNMLGDELMWKDVDNAGDSSRRGVEFRRARAEAEAVADDDHADDHHEDDHDDDDGDDDDVDHDNRDDVRHASLAPVASQSESLPSSPSASSRETSPELGSRDDASPMSVHLDGYVRDDLGGYVRDNLGDYIHDDLGDYIRDDIGDYIRDDAVQQGADMGHLFAPVPGIAVQQGPLDADFEHLLGTVSTGSSGGHSVLDSFTYDSNYLIPPQNADCTIDHVTPSPGSVMHDVIGCGVRVRALHDHDVAIDMLHRPSSLPPLHLYGPNVAGAVVPRIAQDWSSSPPAVPHAPTCRDRERAQTESRSFYQ